MGERSFAEDVKQLGYGEGQILHGEATLAITKALLQSGVSYVGGYPGAPVSYLIDVLADANEPLLNPLGIYFEQSGSEAAAAALLGASINYPMRGAVTWKSVVGTNVASDALSHVASAGVIGGAVVVIGEDYGEGASILQERTHSTALKSSLPLLDPRNSLESFARFVEEGFGLSEACHQPVLFSIRIRACHMRGTLRCRDNARPKISMLTPLGEPSFSLERINLPPFTYQMEAQKFEKRLPAAQRYIVEHGLNEHHRGDEPDVGIVMQGGLWNTTLRGLHVLGLADTRGRTAIPLLVLNAIHPLVPDELVGFLRGKRRVLVVEEGMPNYIERVHGVPGASGVQRAEDPAPARAGGGRHARRRGHRVLDVLDPSAVQCRELGPRVRHGARVIERRRAALRKTDRRGDGRRRLLAQRLDERRRERDVQPTGLGARDPRQLLRRGHGPAPRPVDRDERPQRDGADGDPRRAARARRQVDPHRGLLSDRGGHPDAPRGAHDASARPQGHHRAERVHARAPAP